MKIDDEGILSSKLKEYRQWIQWMKDHISVDRIFGKKVEWDNHIGEILSNTYNMRYRDDKAKEEYEKCEKEKTQKIRKLGNLRKETRASI